MQLRPLHLAVFVALLAGGCELVADFDRGKIPGNATDSGVTLPPPDDDDGDDTDDDAGAAADAGKPDASG